MACMWTPKKQIIVSLDGKCPYLMNHQTLFPNIRYLMLVLSMPIVHWSKMKIALVLHKFKY